MQELPAHELSRVLRGERKQETLPAPPEGDWADRVMRLNERRGYVPGLDGDPKMEIKQLPKANRKISI